VITHYTIQFIIFCDILLYNVCSTTWHDIEQNRNEYNLNAAEKLILQRQTFICNKWTSKQNWKHSSVFLHYTTFDKKMEITSRNA